MDSVFCSRSLAYRAAAGHDDSTGRNGKTAILIRTDISTIYGIVQCCGSVDYDSGTENCALPYQDTLLDAAISTHENIVLNDYRHCADRLEHATDLGGSSDVDVLSDLRAGPHKCVRINH